jgi:cobaltochelatase CobN
MKKEGFEGANKMAEFVDNMWGWQVTMPETIDAARWEQTFEVYVTDKYGMDLEEFFNEKNPYAYQSITARMLEIIRKDYWHPTEEVKQSLAKEYIEFVAEHGAACSVLICNNPVLEEYATDVVANAGLLNQETLNSYTEIIRVTTGKGLNERNNDMHNLVKTQAVKPKQSPGQMKQDEKLEEKPDETAEQKTENLVPEETEAIEGYEMEEEIQKTEKGISASSTSWITIVVILMCIGLFYYGWRKGKKQC